MPKEIHTQPKISVSSVFVQKFVVLATKFSYMVSFECRSFFHFALLSGISCQSLCASVSGLRLVPLSRLSVFVPIPHPPVYDTFIVSLESKSVWVFQFCPFSKSFWLFLVLCISISTLEWICRFVCKNPAGIFLVEIALKLKFFSAVISWDSSCTFFIKFIPKS